MQVTISKKPTLNIFNAIKNAKKIKDNKMRHWDWNYGLEIDLETGKSTKTKSPKV